MWWNYSKFNFSTRTILIFQSNTTVEFINNYGQTSGAILLNSKSQLKFSDSQTTFKNNTGLQCGGIMATSKSNVTFNSSAANFFSNFGGTGGAISLHSQSVLTVNGTVSRTQLSFLWNRAQKGGAIFVDDNTYIFGGQFLISAFELVGSLVHLYFDENTAAIGGNSIYGGWIDWSVNKQKHLTYNPNRISNYLEFGKEYFTNIASDPVRICICQNNIPDCNNTNWKVDLYQGQPIEVELVAVGQKFGTVMASVRATLENNDEGVHPTSNNYWRTSNYSNDMYTPYLQYHVRE